LKAVIQRVSQANVHIDGEEVGGIKSGLLVLIGIEDADTEEDIQWLAAKIVNLRIFSDAQGVMNLSLKEIKGDLLLVSQFTLHAATKRGNRPSYIKASRPEIAIPIYERMIVALEDQLQKQIQTGKFGADMQVQLINDGPVTILIDTKTAFIPYASAVASKRSIKLVVVTGLLMVTNIKSVSIFDAIMCTCLDRFTDFLTI